MRPLAAIARLHVVAGNNDGVEIVARFGRRTIITEGGVRIGMIHGDGVRGTTLSRALEAFAPADVDAIAFGHSHVPYLERHGAVWLLNPGSPTDKRRQPYFSYAIIETAENAVVRPRLVFFS